MINIKYFFSLLNKDKNKNKQSIKIISNKTFSNNYNNNNNISYVNNKKLKNNFFYYQQKKTFCENKDNKDNIVNKNYTDFRDFVKSQSTKKSKTFIENEKEKEDKINYENNNDDNNNNNKENSKDDDTNNFSSKNFTRKQINQKKNFLSQRKKLAANVKSELDYFKLDENFKLDNLRKKYLFFAKLYHPDIVNSDKKSGENFTLLKNNYEKLKIYCEMRDKLGEIEKNIEDNGTIVLETYEVNWSNLITQPEKQEIIKEIS
jgi:hypothetical protein